MWCPCCLDKSFSLPCHAVKALWFIHKAGQPFQQALQLWLDLQIFCPNPDYTLSPCPTWEKKSSLSSSHMPSSLLKPWSADPHVSTVLLLCWDQPGKGPASHCWWPTWTSFFLRPEPIFGSCNHRHYSPSALMSVVLKSPATFSFLDKLLPPTPQSSDTCKSLFFFNPSNTSGFLLRPQKLQIFQYDDMCLSVILCCGRPCLSLLSAPPNPSKSCCPSSLKKKKKKKKPHRILLGSWSSSICFI